MSDYIKREDAVEAFYTATGDGDKADWCVGVIMSIPDADVVERKVGRWMPSTVIIPVKNTDGTYSNFGTLVCSSCNNPVALVVWDNFCPNCGADMRKGGET